MLALDARSPRRPATARGSKAHVDHVRRDDTAHPRAAQPTLRLIQDDRANLDRLATAATRHLHLLLDDAGRKEILRSAFDLAEGLNAWLRRAAPELYGREPGLRP